MTDARSPISNRWRFFGRLTQNLIFRPGAIIRPPQFKRLASAATGAR
jgi:hypothetical protein